MKKRMSLALATGALVAVMLPGAVAAAGPSTAWTRQFGTSDDDRTIGIAIDADGNRYVVGDTGGEFPGQTSQGSNDAFVRKYRPNGGTAWTRQFGTSSEDYPSGIATGPSGGIAVVGDTRGTFPGQTSQGETDAFVAMLRPDGSTLWTRQFGTSDDDDEATDVAIDRSGRIAVAGDTGGTFFGQTNQGDYDAFVRSYRR